MKSIVNSYFSNCILVNTEIQSLPKFWMKLTLRVLIETRPSRYNVKMIMSKKIKHKNSIINSENTLNIYYQN